MEQNTSDGWLPIETVPKDGTVVMLHHSLAVLCGYGPAARPKKAIAIGYYDGWWHTGVPGGSSEGGGDSQFTHWKPLGASAHPEYAGMNGEWRLEDSANA